MTQNPVTAAESQDDLPTDEVHADGTWVGRTDPSELRGGEVIGLYPDPAKVRSTVTMAAVPCLEQTALSWVVNIIDHD